uniref:Immunoglobulin V-set domain-containing protein n=1 Tax=Chelydra serpentina TaxID=8475 RepID=A0A8C3SSQ9_CHESE
HKYPLWLARLLWSLEGAGSADVGSQGGGSSEGGISWGRSEPTPLPEPGREPRSPGSHHRAGESKPTYGDGVSERFIANLERDTNTFSLTIGNVGPADAGTYFCAVWYANQYLFGEGTRLVLGGEPLGGGWGDPEPARSTPRTRRGVLERVLERLAPGCCRSWLRPGWACVQKRDREPI